MVESGAGTCAGFPDVDYEAAGAKLAEVATVIAESAVLVCVRAPGTWPACRPSAPPAVSALW